MQTYSYTDVFSDFPPKHLILPLLFPLKKNSSRHALGFFELIYSFIKQYKKMKLERSKKLVF